MCAKELASERSPLMEALPLGRSYSSGDLVRVAAETYGSSGMDGGGAGGDGAGGRTGAAASADALPGMSAAACPHPYHIQALASTEWSLCWASDESSSDDEAPLGHVGAPTTGGGAALVRHSSSAGEAVAAQREGTRRSARAGRSSSRSASGGLQAVPDGGERLPSTAAAAAVSRRRRRPRPPREVTAFLARITSGKPGLDSWGTRAGGSADAVIPMPGKAADGGRTLPSCPPPPPSPPPPSSPPPSLSPPSVPPLHQASRPLSAAADGGVEVAATRTLPVPAQCKRSSAASISLRRLWRGWMPPERLADLANRPGLHAYYTAQNELLVAFREAAAKNVAALPPADVVFLAHLDATERASGNGEDGATTLHTGPGGDVEMEAGRVATAAKDLEEAAATRVRRAVYASNGANVFLLAAQVYAFLSSGSLALMASTTDAALDFVSGLVVLYTWRLRAVRNKYSYPVGRARMEPLGVVLMACLMTAATLLVLEESISALVRGPTSSPLLGLTPLTACVLLTALGVKGALYAYCQGVPDVAVAALATDHWNDVIANSVSLLTVFAAQAWVWWLDPVGGIGISGLIIYNWVCATVEHVDQLLGRTADGRLTSLVTFLCLKHHPWVLKVDTVRAYHVGAGIFVECDIVLPGEMPLRIAHDIAESLQVSIEAHVDQVERAFVHADFDTDHSPELEHKTV
ncbi:hypothetical protein MMPV_005633 [Pyropia vietnamensis]